MNNIKQKRLTTGKMAAQYYLGMNKYFLVLLVAFGLFDKSSQGTITRPVLFIVALVIAISAAARAQSNMNRIDEEEEDNQNNEK